VNRKYDICLRDRRHPHGHTERGDCRQEFTHFDNPLFGPPLQDARGLRMLQGALEQN